jgi:hypothetical protein
MSIFTSQFDRARQYSQAYTGDTGETRFWTPATITVAVAGAGAAALAAADLAAADSSPSDDTGWGDDGNGTDTSPTGETHDPGTGDADHGGHDDAWSVHSDWTDASVGGEGDFLYFSDGDVSFTVG